MRIRKMMNRILVGILLSGMLSGMLLTVRAADGGNTLPFVPFEPTDTPTEPEIPDEPEVPDAPDKPEVPDTPMEPEIPDTPDPPSKSGIPEWSDIFAWLDEQKKQEVTDKKDAQKEEPEQTDYLTCKRDTTCTMHTFTDLDKTAWYHDGIHYCIENGLMNGTGTNTFEPDTALSRAMIVTVLWRLEGEPVLNCIMPFPDVPDEEWYTEAVRWAAAEGIVNGYEDNTFRPGNSVTCEQVMAILHRYAAYKKLDSGVTLPLLLQYDYSLWAENDILWADMIGLTEIGVDVSDMTIPAVRAEIAAYLMKFCVFWEVE